MAILAFLLKILKLSLSNKYYIKFVRNLFDVQLQIILTGAGFASRVVFPRSLQYIQKVL